MDGTITSFTVSPIRCFTSSETAFNTLPELDDLKLNLANTKNKYDKPYENDRKRFVYITKQFELSSMFKHTIGKKYNTPNVTNAWLKAYEMFSQYKLFPKTAETFIYFDNASFPGSFILAAHHYVKTMCDIKNFKWYGSSLLDSAYLEDAYELYKNYPNNWLMGEKNNGDVTLLENQENFKTKLRRSVDLYTSDLGFSVSGDYNNQETIHAKANLGQVLTGLNVLKNGGVLITKQYTFFEPFTLSLIGCLTFLFRELKIIKPTFSKPGNSEVYLLGIGYRYDPAVVKKISDSLSNWDRNPMYPIISEDCFGNNFNESITKAVSIYKTQIIVINMIIKEFYRLKNKTMSTKYIKQNNVFTKQHSELIKRWEKTHTIKYLRRSEWLNIKKK